MRGSSRRSWRRLSKSDANRRGVMAGIIRFTRTGSGAEMMNSHSKRHIYRSVRIDVSSEDFWKQARARGRAAVGSTPANFPLLAGIDRVESAAEGSICRGFSVSAIAGGCPLCGKSCCNISCKLDTGADDPAINMASNRFLFHWNLGYLSACEIAVQPGFGDVDDRGRGS